MSKHEEGSEKNERIVIARKRNRDTTKVVADRIRKRRKELGITQRELADMIGVDSFTVCRYETGKSNIGIGVLAELANALQCSADYLINGGAKDFTGARMDELKKSIAQHVPSDKQEDLCNSLIGVVGLFSNARN